MKPAGIIGIILIVIGIIALAYGGITYTKREKVLDLGPIQATAEKQKTIPFPPSIGRDLFGRRNRAGDRRQPENLDVNSAAYSPRAVVCAVLSASAFENGQS